jgi:hypothetical protein
MRSSGFLGAALLLAISALLLQTHMDNDAIRAQIRHSALAALENQQTHSARTRLEHGLDRAVRGIVSDELRRSHDPTVVGQRTAMRLYDALKRIEEEDPRVRFFRVRVNPTDYAGSVRIARALLPSDTADLFTVIVIALPDAPPFAQITLSGGDLQDTTIAGRITAGDTVDYALFPIHYQQTVT